MMRSISISGEDVVVLTIEEFLSFHLTAITSHSGVSIRPSTKFRIITNAASGVSLTISKIFKTTHPGLICPAFVNTTLVRFVLCVI
jgi:hypothetical protein